MPDLTRLMVAIDARWDHLQAAKAAGWKAPPAHPDIDPPHEALQLLELYREAGRMPDVTRRGAEFLALLQESEQAAGELEKALRGNPARQAAFERSQALCARCHAKYRDWRDAFWRRQAWRWWANPTSRLTPAVRQSANAPAASPG